LKGFNNPLEFYQKREKVFYALLELTSACNFACGYCYVHSMQAQEPELSTQELIRLLDEMAAADVFWLTVSGGEVLTRHDLFEILRAAVARRFVVRLKTNGALVTADVARQLADTGIRHAEVTVFSRDESINDRLTGRADSLVAVMQGAEQMRLSGLQVMVTIVPTHISYARIEDTYDWLTSEGYAVRIPLHVFGDDDELAEAWELNATATQKDRLMQLLHEREGMPLGVRAHGLDIAICQAGLSSLVVSPTGDVRACGIVPSVFGNVREQSFQSILESPARRRWTSMTRRDLSRCQGCKLLAHCAYCPGAAERRTGSPIVRDSVTCARGVVAYRAAGGRRDGDRLVLPDPPGGAEE
jgi:AdoMet-dependent heme synthase